MKKIIPIILFLSVLMSCAEHATRNTQRATDVTNLVPDSPSSSPNYWCTWYAQNYWQQRGGEITDFNALTNENAREELTYDHIFDPQEGWATRFLPQGRSDWFILIDHGWQTKADSERILPGAKPFFSLQMDPCDFPEFADADPKISLKLFNKQIIDNGWKGHGIWTRGTIDSITARSMVEWSKYAGIKYWKIDGGGTENFWSYRIKKEIFPELNMEYVTGAGGNL